MRMAGRFVRRTLLAATVGLLVVAGPIGSATGQESLEGTFVVTAGTCTESGEPDGSYFRMVQPGGSADEGPFVTNGDSPCDDGEATPLEPGSDSGLITGTFQDLDAIVDAAPFFGTPFQVLTQSPDGQTGVEVPAPTVEHDGSGSISGNFSAWGVLYNQADYNQGAPKPDGSTPGLTTGEASGTYDPATGAFTLDWVSTISGGAFNNFSGVWHLEGTFRASGDSTPTPTETPTETETPTPTEDDTPTEVDTPTEEATATEDGTESDVADDAVDADVDDTPNTGPVVLPAIGLLGLAAAAGLRRRR